MAIKKSSRKKRKLAETIYVVLPTPVNTFESEWEMSHRMIGVEPHCRGWHINFLAGTRCSFAAAAAAPASWIRPGPPASVDSGCCRPERPGSAGRFVWCSSFRRLGSAGCAATRLARKGPGWRLEASRRNVTRPFSAARLLELASADCCIL